MTHAELAQAIFDVAHLTGEFQLRSGQTSMEYFDKYRFEAQPQLLKQVARQMKALLPTDVDILAGLEMGGIPIATALSLETGIPVCFVRKEAKSYGTCQFAEGVDIKGKKLVVIEDVITTGGQVVLSTNDLRSSGAIIEHVLCAIYRGPEVPAPLISANLTMKALFKRSDFPS